MKTKEKSYSFIHRIGAKGKVIQLVVNYFGVINLTEPNNGAYRHEIKIESVLYNGVNVLEIYQGEEMMDGIEVGAMLDLRKQDTYGVEPREKTYVPRLSTV